MREEFTVVRSSRFAAWLMSAASLAVVASGCNTAPKTASTGNLPQKTPAVATKPAPEPPEFMFGKDLKDPVKVHLAYGTWHEQDGNLAEARISYDKVLQKNPKNVDAMMGLARLDIAMGRMDDAEKRLAKARKIAPKDSKVAVSYGQYFSAKGDWPRALEYMTEATELAPYDTACAYHLGYVQAKSGDLTSALASFTTAVGAAEAEYNLAYIMHEQGNLLQAEEHLHKAIALKPDLAQAQTLLITIRQQRSNTKPQVAQMPGAQSNKVQAASYTEPSQPLRSAFDPVPGGR